MVDSPGSMCKAINSHADAVLIARLLAGYTPLLKAYAHLLDYSTDQLCHLCKEGSHALEI